MTENKFSPFMTRPRKGCVILRVLLSVCLAIMLGFVFVPAASGNQDAMERADLLYAEGSMESLRLSAKIYNTVSENRPGSYQAAWKGARSTRRITRLAVVGEVNDLERISETYGKQGMKMAQKAIELNPRGVEGHFYYAVNVGGYAKGASIWAVLNENLKDKARKHLKKAYDINKGYNEFVLVMHMGLYYEVLPWFAGRDREKALEHYREALHLMPEDARYMPQLKVLAGNLMLEQGVEEKKAERLLRETAESGSDYFSSKAREALSEHGKDLAETSDDQKVFKGSLSHSR